MIIMIPFTGKEGHEDGSYHSEFCAHGAHVWDFRSDLFPQWTGTIKRISGRTRQYEVTTTGQMTSMELSSFFDKFNVITNTGRQ
jgi:hypothetical protein